MVDKDIEEQSNSEVLPLETPKRFANLDIAGHSGYPAALVEGVEWSSLLSLTILLDSNNIQLLGILWW